ncbi:MULTISPECIES: class I adenylate-forming enzyme family protein [Mycolicibacter]|uniref:AMP-binding protein n=1 Tax=Mycolicibacter kumamotonensis TaxID=354243 RepID=A0A7K3L7C5_9MYCO|nr:long-chain fatty acid--CoA ligase [Mycolicibacter senuensis]NDJ88030.1 AMP-binding protein [Mycolicibacter kumamotonensis]
MPDTDAYATWSQRVLASLHLRSGSAALISVNAGSVERWSGTEFVAMTAGALDVLDAAGVAAGDDVPALMASRPTSIAMMLAGAVSGRPLAPLAPRMTRRELLACLENLSGGVLFADPDWMELATDLAESTGRRAQIIDGPTFSNRAVTANDNPHSVAMVMHTSGTTGLPKPVPVRESPLGHRADVNGLLLDLKLGDRLATAALFHHVGALGNIAVTLANGATLVCFPDFSVDAWLSLELVAPTHAVVVPSIIEILLAADALTLPTLRVLGYGGSPIHPDTMRRVQTVMPGVDLVNLFGQTEGSPLTVLDAADHRAAAAGRTDLLRSAGRAAPGVELHIDHPGPDGVGEVWARCAHSFVTDGDGWQRTGDLGHLVDGYLYLVGRRGDKIIRGGENVFPLEVEQVLESHPEVREAGVVGVPDRRLGETVAAFIVPTDPAIPPSPQALHRYAREHLAGFKVPARWEFLEALPRNPSGKIVRRELARRCASQ